MKTRKPPDNDDALADPLGPREEEILRAVLREHTLTGDPIASGTVSRHHRLALSPATIRNVMAELERRGLLRQPHTSAGRVPTDRAWRWYVDRMVGRTRVPLVASNAIDQALLDGGGELPQLLSQVSRLLSRFSNQVGVVLAPGETTLQVERVEFVRLDSRRVVAVVVGRSGEVTNRILAASEPREQGELDWAGRYLTEEFGGRTLPEIRDLLRQRIHADRRAYDRLVAASLDLGRQTVEGQDPAAVFVDGASNLVGAPEFADPEKMRSLMQALERKQALVDLLGRILDERGVQVLIGEEQPLADLADCSVVAASYGPEGRALGTLGIVGPKRMEYARVIALVDYLARELGRLLAGPDIDEPPRRGQISEAGRPFGERGDPRSSR
jgi:heat-inducible transcriptional repressor